MDINVYPISGSAGIKKFVKSQFKFYKNDPNFVPKMIAESTKQLNKEKNPFFEHSDIQLYLAEKNGEIAGRIAAIKNGNHNKTHKDKVGFFGFFECIDDQDVANALFTAAEDWLKKQGFDTIRGPMNPSLNDECALLIDGFDSPPVVMMPYNPKYYLKLIEGAGLAKAKDLNAYFLDQKTFKDPKIDRLQNIIRKRHNIVVRNVNFKNKEQYHKDVDTLKYLYNEAWEPNWGFVKMTEHEFDHLAADLKKVAEPSFTMIVEVDGEPAGFALGLPDINQCLIHNKKGGTLGGIYHLLTKYNKIDSLRIIVLGIIPKYQKSGADAVLYWEFGERAPKLGIENAEASWVLEDNLMMNRGLTITMKGKLYKRYRIYEKAID